MAEVHFAIPGRGRARELSVVDGDEMRRLPRFSFDGVPIAVRTRAILRPLCAARMLRAHRSEAIECVGISSTSSGSFARSPRAPAGGHDAMSSLSRRSAALAFALIATGDTHAQSATLLLDPLPGADGTEIVEFIPATDAVGAPVVYFITSDADIQNALWKTDGTPGGTVRISGRRVWDYVPFGSGKVLALEADEAGNLSPVLFDEKASGPVPIDLGLVTGETVSVVAPVLYFGTAVVTTSLRQRRVSPSGVVSDWSAPRWFGAIGSTSAIFRGVVGMPATVFDVAHPQGLSLAPDAGQVASLPSRFGASGNARCGKAHDGSSHGTIYCQDLATGRFERLEPETPGVPLQVLDGVVFHSRESGRLSFKQQSSNIGQPGGPWCTDGSSGGTRRVGTSSQELMLLLDGDHVFYVDGQQWMLGHCDGRAPISLGTGAAIWATAPVRYGDMVYHLASHRWRNTLVVAGDGKMITTNGTVDGTQIHLLDGDPATQVRDAIVLDERILVMARTQAEGYSLWSWPDLDVLRDGFE